MGGRWCFDAVTAENIRAIVAKASPSEDDSHDSHMTEDGDDGRYYMML